MEDTIVNTLRENLKPSPTEDDDHKTMRENHENHIESQQESPPETKVEQESKPILPQDNETNTEQSPANKRRSLFLLQNLIQNIKKKVKDRATRDHLIVQTYLAKSELIKKKKKSITDESSINKIIVGLANNIIIKDFSKNETIIKIGEVGDTFYFVLKGKVKILKPLWVKYHLTPLEYFSKLLKLLLNKDNYLLNKTIAKNSGIYPIDLKDISKINSLSNSA